jgi:hypothetical protein
MDVRLAYLDSTFAAPGSSIETVVTVNLRIILGLVIAAIGIALLPFGHWVGGIWFFIGMALFVVGAALATPAKGRTRVSDCSTSSGLGDHVPPAGEAAGFSGAQIFGGHDHGDAHHHSDTHDLSSGGDY